VTYISNIHDVSHGKTELGQRPAQHVFKQVGSKVPYVSIVVHGWPAAVHRHLPGHERNEILDTACCGIIQFHGQGKAPEARMVAWRNTRPR
jgi:hypothetical protein